MRVLVCGGRHYADRVHVEFVLDQLLQKSSGISCLLNGGATGADTLAHEWAKKRGVESERYFARWDKYGISAGPRRNKVMLEHGKPDLVVAFPGGNGTAHMCSIARRAGVPVQEINPSPMETLRAIETMLAFWKE